MNVYVFRFKNKRNYKSEKPYEKLLSESCPNLKDPHTKILKSILISPTIIFRMLQYIPFSLLVVSSLAQNANSSQGALSLPNPRDCANRIKHGQFNDHNYFFSWEYELTKELKVDWVTARNICRRHCMDLISIETR